MSQILVSHSEADSHVLCELRHYYGYGEKITKATQSVSLQRGIAGHDFMKTFFSVYKTAKENNLDAWFHAKAELDVKFAAAIASHDFKMLTYLYNTINGFLDFYKDRILKWDIVEVEEEHRLDCGDFIYAFQPDAIIKEEGRLKVVDWKFVYDFYDDDMISLAPQIPRYIGALRALGLPISKGLYGFLRYRNVKEDGEGNRFLLTPNNPTPERVENAFKDLILSVGKIAEAKKQSLEVWHHNTRRAANSLICKSCGFKQLCVAEFNGSDGKLIRQLQYVPSTYGYSESDD